MSWHRQKKHTFLGSWAEKFGNPCPSGPWPMNVRHVTKPLGQTNSILIFSLFLNLRSITNKIKRDRHEVNTRGKSIAVMTYTVWLRGVPMNPFIDDRFLLPGHIFRPWWDPVKPLPLLGVNNHLGNETNECFVLQQGHLNNDPERGHSNDTKGNLHKARGREQTHTLSNEWTRDVVHMKHVRQDGEKGNGDVKVKI